MLVISKIFKVENDVNLLCFLEAEKNASVAKIVWERKVKEKESEKLMSEIEGNDNFTSNFPK